MISLGFSNRGGTMVAKTEVGHQKLIGLTDILKGLLRVSWRIPSVMKILKEASQLEDDTVMSVGSVIEENARQYGDRPAVLYEGRGLYAHPV